MPDFELRKRTIGCSEAGAFLQCDEFCSIWEAVAYKKGMIERGEAGPEAIIGQLMEPAMLNIYGYLTGRKVVPNQLSFPHPEWPWLSATPDGFIEGERRGVDSKVVFNSRAWGDTAEQMPLKVQAQMLLYMEAFDYPAWDVVALIHGRARVFSMERDREAGAALRAHLEKCWRRYVIGNEMPPLDGSAGAKRWLQQTYPHHAQPDIIAADADVADLLDDYLSVRVKLNQLTEEKGRMESRIKEAIAQHEGVRWADGRVTWRRTKDGKTTDWHAMALGLQNQFLTDPAQRKWWEDFYTKKKLGTRRFLLTSRLLKEPEAEADE